MFESLSFLRSIDYGTLSLEIPENIILTSQEILRSEIFKQISDAFMSYKVELADIYGNVTMQEIFVIFLILERKDEFKIVQVNAGLNYFKITRTMRNLKKYSSEKDKTQTLNGPHTSLHCHTSTRFQFFGQRVQRNVYQTMPSGKL